MPSQTDRTTKRDALESHAGTRSRAHAGTVLRHEMTVLAATVADVVSAAGGWLYDRSMAGWKVDVLLGDRDGERALHILGAHALDLSGDFDAITDDPDRVATLAVAADVYESDARVRHFVSTAGRCNAEVALWGEARSLGGDVSAVSYRLTAAARLFKAQALLAAGIPDRPVTPTEALFRCGVTSLASLSARSLR